MSARENRLVIFGVSNILSDIFDAARALNLEIKKIIQNQPEVVRMRTKSLEARLALLSQRPVVDHLDAFIPEPGESYIIGISAAAKSGLVELLQGTHGLHFRTLIHPTAYVSPYATIGEGVFVGANSVVAPGAEVGNHVYINRGVTLGHDTIVGDYARLFAGCNVGGHALIGGGATIGLGAAVIEERVIGADAFVAAGSVVTEDVEEATLVAGIPAVLKKRLKQRVRD